MNIISHKKEWHMPMCNNMDEPRGHYAEGKKSEKDKHQMNSHMWTLKSKKQTKGAYRYKEQISGYQRHEMGMSKVAEGNQKVFIHF